MLNESPRGPAFTLDEVERPGFGSQSEPEDRSRDLPKAPADPAPAPESPAAPDVAGRAAAGDVKGQAPAPAAPARKSIVKRLLLVVLALGALGAGGWFGYGWWTDGRFLVSTDDAYVSADMAVLTPKITGYVARVPVAENQPVAAGDPIVEIDPGDYQLALDAAEAKIATQRSAIDRIAAEREAAVEAVAQAQATSASAAAVLDQARLSLQRIEELTRSGAGTQASLDAARSTQAQSAAAAQGAEASIAAARAEIGVLDAQADEARSLLGELGVARDQARRDLSFTTLRAPYAGIVGNLSVQTGDLVSPSRRLASIVPLDEVFIQANFKETQTGEIVPGQRVRIEVDALPGAELHGTVGSLSPASGSVFSLLPADNATGNFTKIVQRVPVRIEIDADQPGAASLRPGLSVTVAVDRRTTPAEAEASN